MAVGSQLQLLPIHITEMFRPLQNTLEQAPGLQRSPGLTGWGPVALPHLCCHLSHRLHSTPPPSSCRLFLDLPLRIQHYPSLTSDLRAEAGCSWAKPLLPGEPVSPWPLLSPAAQTTACMEPSREPRSPSAQPLGVSPGLAWGDLEPGPPSLGSGSGWSGRGWCSQTCGLQTTEQVSQEGEETSISLSHLAHHDSSKSI